MAFRWLTRAFPGRRGSARSAAGPSPAAPSDPNVRLLPAGTSPSAPTTGSRTPAAPPSAFHAGGVVSSPGSATTAWMADYTATRFHGCCPCHDLAPPPLDDLDGSAMLAVGAVPGKILEEWRHAAYGVWVGWPHAQGAAEAEEMTAAQLRDLLAARDMEA